MSTVTQTAVLSRPTSKTSNFSRQSSRESGQQLHQRRQRSDSFQHAIPSIKPTPSTTSPSLRVQQSPSLSGIAAQARLTPKLTSTKAPTTSSTDCEASSSSTQQNQSNQQDSSKKLILQIDQRLYDLSKWQYYHPGGQSILQPLHMRDATDAFYALHSNQAINKLKKMHSVPVTTNLSAVKLPSQIESSTMSSSSSSLSSSLHFESAPPPSAASIAFRQFRSQLISEGWFEKSIGWELFYQSHIYLMFIAGILFVKVGLFQTPILNSIAAIVLLGLAQTEAGWVGHDNSHSRGAYSYYASRIMSGCINAFSPRWWSNKHNTHHIFTNHVGIDVDIENDPVVHLAFPKTKSEDYRIRAFQHLYFVPVVSVLFLSWRIQSFQHAFIESFRQIDNIKQAKSIRFAARMEFAFMIFNYALLIWIGVGISFASILLAGLLVALIVTATHQSEEIIMPIETVNNDGKTPVLPLSSYSFVECQFSTTRDVETVNPFVSWLWGGMQYQLEHHLFPTMPKYYYSRLVTRVKAFAKQNGLEYKVDTVGEIMARNYATLKHFAGELKDETIGTGAIAAAA